MTRFEDMTPRQRTTRAHAAVREAIRRGLLARADKCEDCDKPGKTVDAHYDYREPLRVRWLCQRCNILWDIRELKNSGNTGWHLPQRKSGRKPGVRRARGLYTDRAPAAIYVSQALWKKFQAECVPVSASRVLEEWMRQALEELDKKAIKGKVKRK